MSIAIGSQVGTFRVIESLGRGGMASVFKAYEPELDRYVALKVLPSEFLHDPDFADRFHREAKVIARLEHRHIVPIYAFGIEKGIPWMAMRLLPEGSLARLLERGRVDPARAVTILSETAEALDHAHSQGVLHRDVKPQNILLDEQGHAYLADFGIAKMVENSAVVTKSGVVTGTPQYMSPEQAQAQKADHRTDIYALGVVAYEMFAGRVPFSADTPVAVLLKLCVDPIPIPPATDVHPAVLRPILKALARDRGSRWKKATAFTEALREATGIAAPASVTDRRHLSEAPTLAYRSHGVNGATPAMDRAGARPGRGPAPRARRVSRLTWSVAACAVLAIGAAAGLALRHTQSDGRDPVGPSGSGEQAFPSAAPTALPPTTPLQGRLDVRSEPPGATIFLSGTERGVTPLVIEGLDFGTYEVRLALKGYAPQTLPIVLTTESPHLVIGPTLTSANWHAETVEILSNPSGADVQVDGVPVGQTPATTRLPLGGHSVLLTKDRYAPWRGTLEVQWGRSSRVHAQLSMREVYLALQRHERPSGYQAGDLGVTSPVLISRGQPFVRRTLPEVQCAVGIDYLVDEKGAVVEAQFTGPPTCERTLDAVTVEGVLEWALDSVKSRRFRPGSKDGAPVRVWMHMNLTVNGHPASPE